jgi:hypothetical protein
MKNGNGSLVVYGYLRGNKLNPNNLVYIPSIGTFQIDKIDVLLNHPCDVRCLIFMIPFYIRIKYKNILKEQDKGQSVIQTFTSNPNQVEDLKMEAEQQDEDFPIDEDEEQDITQGNIK